MSALWRQPCVAPPGSVGWPGRRATLPAARPEFTRTGFGDWVLRCTQPDRRAKNCEIAQSINAQGQVVAQFALGRTEAGQPIRLTPPAFSPPAHAAPPPVDPRWKGSHSAP
ncbi:MAG: invasion associated locus B family protein [Methylocystis sp.]|nr:invasion associated locus B family protein [Methylocystis sp.]